MVAQLIRMKLRKRSGKSRPFWRPAFCVFRAESPVQICRRQAIVRSTVRAILPVMWPLKLGFPGHERLGFIAVSRPKRRIRPGFEGEVARTVRDRTAGL